jgi:glycosyltransferase involved in cell wall biosynthesis
LRHSGRRESTADSCSGLRSTLRQKLRRLGGRRTPSADIDRVQWPANIERIQWLGAGHQVLLVSGWAIGAASQVLPKIRWCQGDRAQIGYYGLRRPDVAAAHPDKPQAGLAGFSLLVEARQDGPTAAIELEHGDSWRQVASIHPATVTSVLAGESARETQALSRASRPRPRPAVLFISHDITPAGAQIFLLRLLQAIRSTAPFDIEILVDLPRPYAERASEHQRALLDEFQAIGPVHCLSELTGAPENLPEVRAGAYSLLYANTITLGPLLDSLQPVTSPIISHVHELGFWMEHRTGLDAVRRQVRHTHRFVACSRAVREYLVDRLGVEAGQVETIHSCASTAKARAFRAQHSRAEVRSALGIPEEAFVVAACGTFDWRKGAELFVPICVALRRRLGTRPFRAYWIGAYGQDIVKQQFDFEIAIAGLADEVQLLGAQSEPLRWMLAADCLALPSREDPFPIVMLEAASLGLPVVGFQGSGGVVEFVENGAGLVVPYLDVEGFAAALARLADDPRLVADCGREAASSVERRYDLSVSSQRVLDLVSEVLSASCPA